MRVIGDGRPGSILDRAGHRASVAKSSSRPGQSPSLANDAFVEEANASVDSLQIS